MIEDGPELLVRWDPAWQSFVGALGAALARSPSSVSKAAVVDPGIRLRSPLISLLLHCAVLLTFIRFLPELRSVAVNPVLEPPTTRANEVIYYFGPQLPEIPDIGGAKAGSGKAGLRNSEQHYHPTQAIRIARGAKSVDKVVDAPALRLPPSPEPVANLLALANALPPFPVESLASMEHPTRLSMVAPSLALPSEAVTPPIPSTTLPVAAGPEVQAVLQPEPALPKPAQLKPATQMSPLAEALHRMVLSTPPPIGGADGDSSSATEPRTEKGAVQVSDVAKAKTPFAGVVISTSAGERVGLPDGGTGSLSMSERNVKPGSSAWAGGPSSDATGGARSAGNGGASSGAGAGSTLQAHLGNSPNAGIGGAGNKAVQAARAGVSIRRGVIYVPSFSDGAVPYPGVEQGQAPAIIVISTPRAGGLLDPALAANGVRVYTTYFETKFGTAVLQFADPAAASGFTADLIVPQPLHIDMPADVAITGSTVIRCVLDRLGNLDALRIVRTPDASLVPKLLEVVKSWKFKPALRNNLPVEVTAALGLATNRR